MWKTLSSSNNNNNKENQPNSGFAVLAYDGVKSKERENRVKY